MSKPFLIFTSPVNEKIIQKYPKEIYLALGHYFKFVFDQSNTGVSYDARLDPTRMHVFENSEYIGCVFMPSEEGSVKDGKVSSKH